MFINLAKPQTDTAVLSRDNVFASPAAAAALTPWCFHLNQINIAHFLDHQPAPHDMSFNKQPMSLNSGWSQQPGAVKQDEPQQHEHGHGLPVYGTGYCPQEPQYTAGSVPLSTTDEHSALTVGNRTSRSSGSSYVNVSAYSGANVAAGSELLDSSYWQLVPPGLAPAPSFAPPHLHGGDPIWQPSHSGANPATLEYSGQYTLDVHASVIPQTVFQPGDELHDLPLAAMAERDPASSANSKLYSSSDMLEGVEAMVLNDDPGQLSSWTPPGYDHGVTAASSSSWGAEPSGTADCEGKTVSPKMLHLRPTPSPVGSCESLRTSFMPGDSQPSQVFSVHEPFVPSQAMRPAVSSKKSRKLLPYMTGGQRPILPASHHTSRRRKTSDPPPSPPRRLTRLRPKPEQPPASAAAALGSKGIDLADRMSKDDFLVRQKQLGLTYKEIRRMGGFTEAESTLRGRYRTLTKSREARVRKPEWSQKDLRLLEKAVRTLAPNLNITSNTSPTSASSPDPGIIPSSAKVPWKKVAEYIVSHGGTYHFGNSTCRKRWDELVREQAARGKDVREGWFFFDDDDNDGDGDNDDESHNDGEDEGNDMAANCGDDHRSMSTGLGGVSEFGQGYHIGYGQGM